VHGDDFAARAAGGAEPEIDERRPLDHRVVADDEADVGALDGGERRPKSAECRMTAVGQDRGMRAEAVLHEPRDRRRLLDGLAP
jgi:hypothetical protein